MKLYVVCTHIESENDCCTTPTINGIFSTMKIAQKEMKKHFLELKETEFSDDLDEDDCCEVEMEENKCSIFNTFDNIHYGLVFITECELDEGKDGFYPTIQFAVIQHNDDSTASIKLLGIAFSHTEAISIVFDKYYGGDKEQMDAEYQGNDYWDNDCKGVEIVSN